MRLSLRSLSIKRPIILSCFVWTSSAWTSVTRGAILNTRVMHPQPRAYYCRLFSSQEDINLPEPPLYLQEGLFAVEKPLEWTSQQVVGRVRALLEKDAKARGVPDKRKKRRRPWMKVGHGGTLDPLASGVLVVGVGKGTKNLQKYLVGSKGYKAGVELGFQTTTLDMDTNGEVIDRKPFDHVTIEAVEDILSQFRGTILQKPPIFSALKKDGRRLYELGREGKTDEDVEIEPREVQIHRLELIKGEYPSKFQLEIECGGGTYIRSLVRDIGIALDTVATMTSLERTKQGQFFPEDSLNENDWTAENVYKTIEESKILVTDDDEV